MEIAIPIRDKDFNDVNKSSGVQGVVDTKAISVDKILVTPNKIDMNHDQIKKCLETISRQMKIETPENKNQSIEKNKNLTTRGNGNLLVLESYMNIVSHLF